MRLVTDREQANVDRLKALKAKGWANMTDSEKAEWSGNPHLFPVANWMPHGPNYPAGVEITYRGDSIVATAVWDGMYVYATSIIGDAADFEGKTVTLSVESMVATDGGTPQLLLYWHDENGAEYAGGPMTEAGSMTITLSENAGNRAHLAMYIYVATDVGISAGAIVRYNKVMLELGETAHEYVPYYEIVPTAATKGGYNYADLNRVERAVAEISNIYDLGLVTKTDWAAWDMPTQGDLERYISNIELIREYWVPDAMTPSNMAKLTYVGANNIEKVLSKALSDTEMAYRSGDLLTGEVTQ